MTEQEAANGMQTPQPNCFCMGVGPQVTEALRKLGPESAMSHFRRARLEILKGLRALIDARIEQISREQQKGTKVHVE